MELNWGKAVAIVDLTVSFPTEDIIFGEPLKEQGPDEFIFGDFRPGRFGYKLEDLRRIKKPFPVTGKRGVFSVDVDWGKQL